MFGTGLRPCSNVFSEVVHPEPGPDGLIQKYERVAANLVLGPSPCRVGVSGDGHR